MLHLSDSNSLKVLFVEDDQDHFDYYCHLLAKIDVELNIGRSTSLKEADERLAEETFDLVLLDLGLPDSTGIETVEHMIAKTDTPIVVVSAQSNGVLAREAIRFGAQDFLVKSEITRHSLGRAVLYAVDRLQLAREAADMKQFSTEFLRTVSHDLRAPLARLANLAQVVSDQVGEQQGTEEVLEFLKDMEGEATYLSHYIKHLYGFCKSEDAMSALSLEPVSLIVPIMRTLDVLGKDMEQVNAQICIGEMPIVNVDESLMSHVFQNIISNSLKYSGSNRPAITISAVRHPTRSVVTISDNGIGVPPEELDKVFEPFYRSDNKGLAEGSGVGLAFCKKVITCHGGRIWASSSGEQGCTISFTLPSYS